MIYHSRRTTGPGGFTWAVSYDIEINELLSKIIKAKNLLLTMESDTTQAMLDVLINYEKALANYKRLQSVFINDDLSFR